MRDDIREAYRITLLLLEQFCRIGTVAVSRTTRSHLRIPTRMYVQSIHPCIHASRASTRRPNSERLSDSWVIAQIHLDAQVVQAWGPDFNLDEVQRIDTEILSSIDRTDREYVEMVHHLIHKVKIVERARGYTHVIVGICTGSVGGQCSR